MKLFAPPYYKAFKCIADRCLHSCCVGWEIDIDRASLLRYEALGDFGREIIESIDFESDIPHFRLTGGGSCPHLDENGLCRIISGHGEEYLSDICREHPRFFNTVSGMCEAGLGAVCEEAARLILECGDYTRLCEIGELDGDGADFEFDVLSERGKVFSILSDSSLPYTQRLSRLYEIYGIFPSQLTDREWHEVIDGLEFLSEKSREDFGFYSSELKACAEAEKYLERALAYFIFRHTGTAESQAEFVLALGLSFFLERLFLSLLSSEGKHGIAEAALSLRLISEEIEYSEDNTESIKFAFL